MCEIVEAVEFKGRFLVTCTKYDGDFMNAKSITVFDKSNRPFKIYNFKMDHTRQCFNNAPISPWFGIEENIDGRYLQKGNKVEFEVAK